MTPAAIREQLGGVSAVLVTPFREGREGGDARIDEDVLSALARGCAAAGVQTVVALGNTAEVYQLTLPEQFAVLRAIARDRPRECALLAGLTGPAETQLELAEQAASLGFDAVMVHEPPDPVASAPGIQQLLLQLAERSPLPLVLYVRTTRLSTSTLLDLAGHPRIIGIKYAVNEPGRIEELLAAIDLSGDCAWVCGLAESMVPTFSRLGVHAFTSGLANVRPDLAMAIWSAAQEGDKAALAERVAAILPFEVLRNANDGCFGVAVLKAALRWYGIPAGTVRPPCIELDDDATNRLNAVLTSWDERAVAPPISARAHGQGT